MLEQPTRGDVTRDACGQPELPAIAAFVRTLRSTLSRPVTVVWDRIAIHDCPALDAELAKDSEVAAELLRAYAPAPDPGELRRTVTAELDRLRKRPDLLRGFVRFTRLPVWEEPDLARTEKPFAEPKATVH